ncbi:MAG: hypothetical protein PHC28_05965 [Flavobacterium sp.]|uniref:hypothetical protein n=1 Tax=Flavobacterium sp. TaxID=239 RepID=UPI0026026347|nr:hypothetical protein [Flavobacterium sp.]MDD5150015.1 hypothetical protein [Flavobacterium sp.]
MKTYNEYITEILSRDYTFNISNNLYTYSFDDNTELRLRFYKMQDRVLGTVYRIDFSLTDTNKNEYFERGSTNKNPITVYDIAFSGIRQFLSTNPSIEYIMFTAEKSEQSRVKFYDRMTKNFNKYIKNFELFDIKESSTDKSYYLEKQ